MSTQLVLAEHGSAVLCFDGGRRTVLAFPSVEDVGGATAPSWPIQLLIVILMDQLFEFKEF